MVGYRWQNATFSSSNPAKINSFLYSSCKSTIETKRTILHKNY